MPDATPTTPMADQSGEAPPRLALRARDAARTLGIGERKLWELTNRNAIPHVKIGRCVLYPTDQLREWLARQAKGGARV